MGDLLHAALGYAALGWPVHPCKPLGKQPLTTHGFRDATTDPTVISQWWRRWAQANVAVATGAPGPDVLDVDTKNGAPGMELFERCRRAGLLAGAAAMISTPSGGLHLWFNGTSQNGGAVHRRALELKAVGGYVLVPPSATDIGTYELIERRDIAGFIDWRKVARLLDPPAAPKPPYRRNAGNGARLAEWLSGQGEGNRNAALFWACCRALESGTTDLADLVAVAVARGLDEREARRTAESARRRIGATI